MRNITLTIASILIVSAVTLNGCQKKQPTAKPEDKPEAQAPKTEIETALETKSKPEAEKAAIDAADAWLKTVDNGDYTKSWEEAAEYFRNFVSQKDWLKSIKPVREPLGKLVQRKFKSALQTDSAPGAPDGQYVIIQYDTSFENKKSAVETVTPMLDKDGQWRVSGYYIK